MDSKENLMINIQLSELNSVYITYSEENTEVPSLYFIDQIRLIVEMAKERNQKEMILFIRVVYTQAKNQILTKYI